MNLTRLTYIAMAAHEMNRVLCLASGDDSQTHWEDAPDWQRTAAVDGIEAVLAGATPEQSHEDWCAIKTRDGWTFGLVKDAATKTHPCLVPYADLPYHQQHKDAVYVAVVRAMDAALPLHYPSGAEAGLDADRLAKAGT